MFKSVFIAVFIGTALIVVALLFNTYRPQRDTEQPQAEFVRATGKCASCHLRETAAVVHQFERSKHAQLGVSCLDCHRPVEGQEEYAHRGFTLAKHLTAKNCNQCHPSEYQQFLRSRHAALPGPRCMGQVDFSAARFAREKNITKVQCNGPANKLAC